MQISVGDRDGGLGTDESLRERLIATFEGMLPEYLARIEWSAARLQEERSRALRALIEAAIRGSRWHPERLAHIDIARMTHAEVEALPVMTKADLMEHFDEIVTDRRLSREACERHLEGLGGDAYLLGEYHVVASGGSTGQRGVYVYGWDAWATCWASMARFPQRDGCPIRNWRASDGWRRWWLRLGPRMSRRRSAWPSRRPVIPSIWWQLASRWMRSSRASIGCTDGADRL